MEEPGVTSGLSHASVNFPHVLPPEQGNRKNKLKHKKMKILLWTLQTCRKPEMWRLPSSEVGTLAGNPRGREVYHPHPAGRLGQVAAHAQPKCLPHCCVNLLEGGTASVAELQGGSHGLWEQGPSGEDEDRAPRCTTCTATRGHLEECRPTVIREPGLCPDPGLGEDEHPPTLGTRASGLCLKLPQLSTCRLET